MGGGQNAGSREEPEPSVTCPARPAFLQPLTTSLPSICAMVERVLAYDSGLISHPSSGEPRQMFHLAVLASSPIKQYHPYLEKQICGT